jgi:hypothetical protein
MHLWIQRPLSIKKDNQHGDSLAKCQDGFLLSIVWH